MNNSQYLYLSKDLQKLTNVIPLHWGTIQNDRNDQQVDLFKMDSFEALENAINHLQEEQKNYFRRRWYLWKCSQCDEYLFYKNKQVARNPNTKDQAYDIEFYGNHRLRFDVKGTIIPKEFQQENLIITEELIHKLITYFYTKQSNGVRESFQNRLFIVHHSEYDSKRELMVRSQWDFKDYVYKNYLNHLLQVPCVLGFNQILCDIIFIIEKRNKELTFFFGSE